jgi:hypothetical protein
MSVDLITSCCRAAATSRRAQLPARGYRSEADERRFGTVALVTLEHAQIEISKQIQVPSDRTVSVDFIASQPGSQV